MKNKLLLSLFLFMILLVGIATAQQCEIYFFYSSTCPHCANEYKFLDELEAKYPDLSVIRMDISENYQLFEQISKQYNTIPVGVPRTYINDTVFVGFTPQEGPLEYSKGYEAYIGYQNQIEKEILDHLKIQKNATEEETCIEPAEPEPKSKIYLIFPAVLLFLYAIFYITFRNKIQKNYLIGGLLGIIIVILFYFSQYIPSEHILNFAKQFSFPVFTFIIALLDGFNPCAFAVLAILLSLLVYAQSKKKMALIGIIFIITSSVMYFLFIIILLTLRAELLGSYKEIIRIVVGIIALIAGSINVKDFFFFKKGISLTISETKMSKIMQKMRNIVNEVREATTPRTMFLAVIGTIILAAFVNLVELGCTLILPIQYIEVLITNYGTHVTFLHYFYIAFYCLIYIIPLLFILGSFLYTFKSERMTETKGRILKLISGIVMIGLGLILLLRPELLVFS